MSRPLQGGYTQLNSTDSASPAKADEEPAPSPDSGSDASHVRSVQRNAQTAGADASARYKMATLKRTWSTGLLSDESSLTQMAACLDAGEHASGNKCRQLIVELRGHTDRTKCCSVFANDKKALSASDDNTLRVWNLETEKCELTLGCDRSQLLEHRPSSSPFPESLGPFGAQRTTLRPILDFKNLTYRLEVEHLREYARRSELARHLWTALLQDSSKLTSSISEPHEITLSDEAKQAAGVPHNATHFVWAYQLEAARNLNSRQAAELRDISGEAAFVLNGGYVYFKMAAEQAPQLDDANEEQGLNVLANALCLTGQVKFQFGRQQIVEGHHHSAFVSKMIEADRFHPVTVTPLLGGGARYYCWVLPGENLGTAEEPWKPCEDGGFMYLLGDERNSNENRAAKDCASSCYFSLTVGHTNWVRGCCLLPGEQLALSCSADTNICVWDLQSGKNTMKLTGHLNWVWNCCAYTARENEVRALSCSSDHTLRVWSLRDGGKEVMKLEGHSGWVMDCCVFMLDDQWMALSSSQDKTLKSWALEGDQVRQCVRTFNGHQHRIGGCQVYLSDGSNWNDRAAGVAGEADRALSCSDDKTLRVWDLRTGECLGVLQGHTNVVIACCVFRESNRHHGVSASADGTLRIWDLDKGTCERVMDDPDENSRVRGCSVTSDGSKVFSCSGKFVRIWDRDLLIKTEPAEHERALTIEEQAEMLWKWWPHMELMEHKVWATRLLHIMSPRENDVLTPFDCQTLLYGKDTEGMTLIHRLAAEEDGAAVMNHIIKWHQAGRRRAVLGAEGNELLERQAEMTLGLVSRAGHSNGRSVLQEAMEAKNVPKAAPMVRLLLDDYCEMVRALSIDAYSAQTFARYHLFEPMVEADVVGLFHRFPRDAASFLQRLQLRPTHGLRRPGQEFIRCDATDRAFDDGMIVQSSTEMQPMQKLPGSQMLWWEQTVEDRFYNAASTRHYCCLQTKKWSTETKTLLVPIVASKLQGESRSDPPFSELLKASCTFAESYRSTDLFDSPVIAAIIAHKWESSCRIAFMTQFCAYVAYLVAFTFLAVADHLEQLSSCDPGTRSCFIKWCVWYLCCAFQLIHLKFEFHSVQVRRKDASSCWAGIKRYFDFWNVLDTVALVLTTAALATMLSNSGWSNVALRIIHASAMFFCWLKLLFFLRGWGRTAPLIKMLGNIVVDMYSFVIVLLIILMCFSLVFFLLLRDENAAGDEHRFDTAFHSFITSYAMVFGNFNAVWFLEAHTAGMVTGMFTLFMFVISVVMLNALIAIMSESYMLSKEHVVANGRMMRAQLILELESLIEIMEPGGSQRPMFKGWITAWRVVQILLTLKMPGDTQVAGTYLHVLSLEDPPSGVEQEYALTSWPFDRNPTQGAPSVGVGDVGHRAGVGATKPDVEKLMAQNVQLLHAMTNQQRQLDQLSQLVAQQQT